MKRWGLWIALMLSLGVNVGVLIMVVAARGLPRRLEEPRSAEPLLPEEPAGPVDPVLPREAEPPPPAPPETETAPPREAVPEPSPPAEPSPRPKPPPAAPQEPPSSAPPEDPAAPEGPTPHAPPAPAPQAGPSVEALRRAEPRLEVLADRLRLRGQQRERFLDAQRRFFTEVTARRVELATLRRELRRQLTSPSPDRQRMRRILERSGRATAELDAAFAQNVLTVRRILGPRQQQAYFRFLERLRDGMELRNRPGERR